MKCNQDYVRWDGVFVGAGCLLGRGVRWGGVFVGAGCLLGRGVRWGGVFVEMRRFLGWGVEMECIVVVGAFVRIDSMEVFLLGWIVPSHWYSGF